MTAHLSSLPNNIYNNQHGLSLIELIITIVVISISLTGIIGVVNQTTRHSVDPIIHHQAIAIAESYLAEIMLLPITASPDISGVARTTFDNISDYNGLSDSGATDQNGTAIVGLELYNVDVATSSPTINGEGMTQVEVTVSRDSFSVSLNGYKAN